MSQATTSQQQKGTYTDSPELHPNLFLSSFQLLFWIVFHPSAWHHYVKRIDPALPAEFALSKLNKKQWRNPMLLRLLLVAYVLWPLWVGIVVALFLGIFGQYLVEGLCISDFLVSEDLVGANLANCFCRSCVIFNAEDIAVGIALSMTSALFIAVIIGFVSGLATGIVSGIGIGILSGILAGVALIDVGILNEIPVFFVNPPLTAVGLSLAYGFVAGAAGSIAFSIPREESHIQYGQIIAIVSYLLGIFILGVVAASVIVFFVLRLAEPIVGNVFRTESFASTTIMFFIGLVFVSIISIAIAISTFSWKRGLIYGLLLGTTSTVIGGIAYYTSSFLRGGVLFVITFGIAYGIIASALFCSLFILPHSIGVRLSEPKPGAIAAAIASGVSGPTFYIWFVARSQMSPEFTVFFSFFNFFCIFAGFTQLWWRPILLSPFLTIWNIVLYRMDEQKIEQNPTFLRLNSAFWNEHQLFQPPGLEDHLILIATRNQEEGQNAINYLTGKDTLHRAAQRAQIEIDAHQLEACTDIETIGAVHEKLEAAGKLGGPVARLLRTLANLSRDVQNASNEQLKATDRHIALSYVKENLYELLQELSRSDERYSIRFYPIVSSWHRLIAACTQEIEREIEESKEIYSPYVVGMPITKQQEVFVGRIEIGNEIGAYFLYEQSPPLFLYGQRRMGKTSLLKNLERLLPKTLISLYVYIDLQGAVTADKKTSTFFYWIAKSLLLAAQTQHDLDLPPLTREQLKNEPFTVFIEWLDEIEIALDAQDLKNVLLAIDEIEAAKELIDKESGFDEAGSFAMLRHLIQHRTRFKILITGAHDLNELSYLASYLINTHTIHISYLDTAAARKLIEHPVKDFPLRYEFEASQKVLSLTRGHPYLIQLLCDRIINLKNRQQPGSRRLIQLADVESAIPEALSYGRPFFIDIQNWFEEDGANLLRFLATKGEGAVVSKQTLVRQVEHPHKIEQALQLLARREIIEKLDKGYRFQVELVRQYFESWL